MKISLTMFRASVVACVALLANAAFAVPTVSSLTIDFNEVGSDVVATVAGSFDISSLIPQTSGSMTMRNFVSPNDGLAGFSDNSSSVAYTAWRMDEQAAYTQPFWGDGSNAGNIPRFATTSSGTGSFYIEGNPLSSPETNEARIRFPSTYAGEAINGTMTWAGQTYASMGLATSGTWNWQTANGGTVALRINAVPEPTGCVGMAFAAVALGVWIRRRAPRA
jgi:hypothetical protein